MGNGVRSNGGVFLSIDLGVVWIIQTDRTDKVTKIQVSGTLFWLLKLADNQAAERGTLEKVASSKVASGPELFGPLPKFSPVTVFNPGKNQLFPVPSNTPST